MKRDISFPGAFAGPRGGLNEIPGIGRSREMGNVTHAPLRSTPLLRSVFRFAESVRRAGKGRSISTARVIAALTK